MQGRVWNCRLCALGFSKIEIHWNPTHMKSNIWIAAWKTPGFADRKHTKSTKFDENFKVIFGVSTRVFFHGLSWVNHGSITGSSRVRRNPGFYIKHGVSCSKPRVSRVKSWVVTGKSRVKHGFRSFKISNPVFSEKNLCLTKIFHVGNPGFHQNCNLFRFRFWNLW